MLVKSSDNIIIIIIFTIIIKFIHLFYIHTSVFPPSAPPILSCTLHPTHSLCFCLETSQSRTKLLPFIKARQDKPPD